VKSTTDEVKQGVVLSNLRSRLTDERVSKPKEHESQGSLNRKFIDVLRLCVQSTPPNRWGNRREADDTLY
jgi:hypothetical protein